MNEDYDCAAYGAGSYNDDSICSTSTPPNTGVATTTASPADSIWTISSIVLGVVLIVSGAIILFGKKLRRQNSK